MTTHDNRQPMITMYVQRADGSEHELDIHAPDPTDGTLIGSPKFGTLMTHDDCVRLVIHPELINAVRTMSELYEDSLKNGPGDLGLSWPEYRDNIDKHIQILDFLNEVKEADVGEGDPE